MIASVVISAFDPGRIPSLVRALESLRPQVGKDSEILVVCDPVSGLREQIAQLLPSSVNLRLVVSPRKGLSSARNQGIRLASGEFVAFLDDDAEASPSWLSALLRPLQQDTRVVAVGGPIVPRWTSGRPVWFPPSLNWLVGCTYEGYPVVEGEIRNVIGCNMAFRREALQSAGLFRPSLGRRGESLQSGEETELCLRLRGKLPGARIVYQPGAIVWHRVGEERVRPSYLMRRAYWEGWSKAMIARMHVGDGVGKVLSTEMSYLHYLVRKTIPRYVVGPIDGGGGESWLKLGAILVTSGSTALGYIRGWLRRGR